MARMLSPLLVVITCLFGATSAWPSTPRDELHRHIEELLNTVDDPSLTAEQRAVHARTTVLKMFDFSDTARRAFGSHWRRLTAAQRDETTGLVGGFLTEALVARVRRAPRRFADRMGDRMVYDAARAGVSMTSDSAKSACWITIAPNLTASCAGEPTKRQSSGCKRSAKRSD